MKMSPPPISPTVEQPEVARRIWERAEEPETQAIMSSEEEEEDEE